MRYTSANRGFPAGNPIANVLVIIVGTLAIAASIVVGFVAFVILGSLLLIMAAIVGVRLWWFHRRGRRLGGGARASARQARKPAAIEGEYRVVRERHNDDVD